MQPETMPTLKKIVSIRVVLLAGLLLSGELVAGQSTARSSAQSPARLSEQVPVLYGASAGAAKAEIRSQLLSLSNQMMEAQWSVRERKLTGIRFVIRGTGAEIALPRDPFLLILKDGTSLRASEMMLTDGPRVEALPADPGASRAAQHFGGRAILVRLQDPAGKISVAWRAILRDGSNYVRDEIAISALHDDEPIAEVRLFDGSVPGASVVGSVKGSPVTAGDLFLGFEDPLAQCEARATVICGMKRELPLRKGQKVDYSLVVGASPPGQMRRGFLNYMERERAHPYRTFLHYNSWYDIGFGKRYDARAVLDVVGAFGMELVRKRGVKMDSFLLDDGWDNLQSIWQMNSGFPGGIAPLNRAAHEYGAAMGVWLSPWGGYDEAKQERIEFGRKNGFEMNEGGFALSGPKYYERFKEVTLGFVKDGVNQFKIDGTGNVDSVFAGSNFDSDFAAAISLIGDWRAKKPDLFVNLTTGTYPSPFWLRYADSIWRGGDDNSFAGVGSWREKWITYRDGQTYQNIVQAGPLFPLNSLMLHGLIYARQAEHLDSDPGNDFTNEVHDYFGTGTQLQEMYISHVLLSKNNWDVLAEAANWSRRNAGTLRDTHWIGGDPGKLEVYGWAAWSRTKGILTLRNPSDRRRTIAIDVGRAFELPPGAPRRFVASSPWKQDRGMPPVTLSAGEEHVFMVEPFEVLTLEARAVTSGGKSRESRDQ
jgi:hypothetical protein